MSYRIMAGHVFFDGNKRTAISTCEMFLAINGFVMRLDKNETVAVAIRVADSCSMDYEEYLNWIRSKVRYVLLADYTLDLVFNIFRKYLRLRGKEAFSSDPNEPLIF